MNDEIKEILKFLKVGIDKLCISKPDFSISYNDVKILLNYITNLQQENEKLLSENITIKSIRNMVDETIYKSRVEKAVEILKDTHVDMPSTLLIETIDNGINILNGEGSDE